MKHEFSEKLKDWFEWKVSCLQDEMSNEKQDNTERRADDAE